VASVGPEERTSLASQFLQETYPDYTLGQFEPATLGSLPARRVQLVAEGKPSITAIVTLSENTLFLVAANEEADAKKFFESFGWFKEPQFPPLPSK
jgi:hypothetical protein